MTRATGALIVLLAAACADAPGPAAGPIGVVDLQGVAIDPLAASGAAATVLVFVSTRCPIANRYAPTLQALAAEFSARGIRAWLVYPDPDDGPSEIHHH